ncbi:hypothetical protein EDC19_0256 [Natranaerovirga hydrolytica]|uniref:Uncharacterized protein n=1 Tax=Natranaerovirga hydrolytica TaxID=680378 RepID=A0A4R1N1I0_9FIRM|nr:hypothetical protein [Natranaerovirga hydrolytica]TCK97854.1 hypothetical protein EDC19_0256 [Natranaerovirga hydrolytica]
MTTNRQRRHYRTAQRDIENSPNETSIIELDFKKTTIIIAIIAFIKGIILGLIFKRK